jgi:hypothetical protein
MTPKALPKPARLRDHQHFSGLGCPATVSIFGLKIMRGTFSASR